MTLSRRTLLAGVGGGVVLGGLGAVGHRARGTSGSAARPHALVAGSLLQAADTVPGATVEAHGSAAVRRLVLQDLREPDAVALADPRLFDGISERATLFATNALVITYSPASDHAAALRDDWRSAVGREGIRLGRTDPAVDPLGYRTVMALRLAERAGDVDADRVLANTDVFPETGLLNAVEGGEVDAAFTYRNMAVQRDLPYVGLPDRIDFSDPAHADTYATVSYDIGERRVNGAPIRYAATALTDAGEDWVERLVGGTERLREHGFTVPAEYPFRDERL